MSNLIHKVNKTFKNFGTSVDKSFDSVGHSVEKTTSSVGKGIGSIGKGIGSVAKKGEDIIGKVYNDSMGILKGLTSPTVLIIIAIAVIILFMSNRSNRNS